MVESQSGFKGLGAAGRLARAGAGVCLLAFAFASGPSTAAPTVIDVQPGDTFSGIAARFTGSPQKWKTLYDAKASRLANPSRIVPGMQFELVEQGDGRRYLRLIGIQAAAATAAAPSAAAPAAPATPTAAKAEAAPAPAPAASSAALASTSDTIVVGVLPNIGAAALMAQYESLKHYLERKNPQKIRIALPANFKAFYDGMMNGEFDLAVAAPHFARVAQRDGRMVPLALYEPRIGAQFITVADSALSMGDLRGKSVAFANPQSLVAMYGRQWLHDHQLEEGKDYQVKAARTDMGVGRMLLTGEVDAAIMSTGEFRSLPPEESSRLKIVDVFARIPNFVVLGQTRLGSESLARLKAQMLAFPADAEDGAAFSKATGISSIVDADEAQLRELDPYVAPTRRAMTPTN